MVLVVPFEGFPEVAKKFAAKEVFLAPRGAGTVVTAANPERDILLTSHSQESIVKVEEALRHHGFHVAEGMWTGSADLLSPNGPVAQEAYVAAVSYESAGTTPGLWLDAFPTQPNDQIVLRAMYEELVANGEIKAIDYDEFLRLAKPNVIVMSPSEIATYILQKQDCP